MHTGNKKFREGATGALLDEYEKALGEFKDILKTITQPELVKIIDSETQDADCRSIQTILTHVVRAGFGYAAVINNYHFTKLDFYEKVFHENISAYEKDLENMFAVTENVLRKLPVNAVYEKDNNKKMVTAWGQSYDLEQLMEHAIVHILRHRRQIEKFIQLQR